MPAYIPPWQRLCNCRCRVHDRSPRTLYDDPGCTCTITCATQPLTLLAGRWNCALFLDADGDFWFVPALPNGAWAWENAGVVDTRSEFYEASVTIEDLLRTAEDVLANTRS